jgi:hypothetical protein
MSGLTKPAGIVIGQRSPPFLFWYNVFLGDLCGRQTIDGTLAMHDRLVAVLALCFRLFLFVRRLKDRAHQKRFVRSKLYFLFVRVPQDLPGVLTVDLEFFTTCLALPLLFSFRRRNDRGSLALRTP